MNKRQGHRGGALMNKRQGHRGGARMNKATHALMNKTTELVEVDEATQARIAKIQRRHLERILMEMIPDAQKKNVRFIGVPTAGKMWVRS